jgi:hypothetical protein
MMSRRYSFDIAQPNDDSQLRACMAGNHMGEGISVGFRREPSYFDACTVQGEVSQIIKCTDSESGRIVGLGSRFVSDAFINGKIQKTGYLADLRCENDARKGLLLARGYQYLHKLHQQNPVDFYYTLILSNNSNALKMLTSQRAGLPIYHSFGKILSPAIHLDLPKRAIKIKGLKFSVANEKTMANVFAFIQKQYAEKQFSPAYQLSDFGTDRLRGLNREDIYVATFQNRIVATIAAWDQSAFRQTYIEKYSSLMRMAKPIYNVFSGLTPLKPLPEPGQKIPHLYFSLMAAENNNTAIFSALLRHVYSQRRLGKWHYAIAGLHEKDPLAECLSSYRSIAASGELFSVSYPGSQQAIEEPSQRIPYIELASL